MINGMFDDLHNEPIMNRMELIMNTHWEEPPKKDLREVEPFADRPIPQFVYWESPGRCFTEFD